MNFSKKVSNKKKLDTKKQWQKENQKAIDEYNKSVQEKGVFSNGLRGF